jgi:hypothetical protein
VIADGDHCSVAQQTATSLVALEVLLFVYFAGGANLPQNLGCSLRPDAEEMGNLMEVEPCSMLFSFP